MHTVEHRDRESDLEAFQVRKSERSKKWEAAWKVSAMFFFSQRSFGV